MKPQQRIHVLVVDDDNLVRKMLADLLTATGYRVHTATDGPTALTHMERARAAVVLTDFAMPHMNGLDLLTVIHARWPESLVILHSGNMSDTVTRQAQAAGAYACLTKQGDTGPLLDTLAAALSTGQPDPAVGVARFAAL